MSVWNAELLKNIGLPSDRNGNWVMESSELLAAIRGGKLDLVCLTVPEYRQVAQYLDTRLIITDDSGGEELLLLVREGSGISTLENLRGRSLIQWDTPRTSLAEPWLAVSLWHEGLKSPKELLGRITTSTKLSQVVLPVFFGQADACLVTRRGLDLMTELNPQLSRKLKVLLASPKMLSVFLAFQKNYPADLRKSVFDRMVALNSNPIARQVLVLFQSPGYTIEDADCVNSANLLFDAYERHRAPAPVRKR
jgi:phosphonate transport system substrate-binding protein